MSIGIWPWLILGLGLFVGFVALLVAIIAIIKTKKFLVPILIYLPFLLVSLVLIVIFVYQVFDYSSNYYNEDDWYFNYNTNTDYDYDYNTNTNTSVFDEYDYYDGYIKNTYYNYIIDVGADREINFWETLEYYPLEGITDTYYYCYATTDYTYEDYNCGTGWVNSFSINVYTEAQWEEVMYSPLVGTLMGQDAGYYFVLSHPNGILPDDVPTTNTFYDSVIYSIDFAD